MNYRFRVTQASVAKEDFKHFDLKQHPGTTGSKQIYFMNRLSECVSIKRACAQKSVVKIAVAKLMGMLSISEMRKLL